MTRHARSLMFIALLCALAPAPAAAHSGDAVTQEIVAFDAQGQQWLARGNFGLLLSDDPTGYVCEEAFLSAGVFRIGALGPRDWLIWTQDQSLWRTQDACSFTKVAALPLYPQAVAAHAPSGRALWVEGEESQTIVWTPDRGETTTRVKLPTPAGVQWTGARFDTADRVALSGYRTDDGASGEGVLGWADLSAESWTPITGFEGAKWPYLLLAGEGQAAGLANKDQQLIAFWSTPETTRTIPLDGWPTGMAFDGQGDIIATGAGIAGGLWRWSPGADVMLPLYEDHSSACLARVGDAWWMCSRSLRDGDDASLTPIANPTTTPTTAIDLTRLTGPRAACGPDTDVGRVCPAVWPELGRTLGVLPPVDLPDMGVTPDHGTGEDMGSADLGSTTPPPKTPPPPRPPAAARPPKTHRPSSRWCSWCCCWWWCGEWAPIPPAPLPQETWGKGERCGSGDRRPSKRWGGLLAPLGPFKMLLVQRTSNPQALEKLYLSVSP